MCFTDVLLQWGLRIEYWIDSAIPWNQNCFFFSKTRNGVWIFQKRKRRKKTFFFFQVPQGATYAEWRLQLVDYQDHNCALADSSPVLNFEYHAVQVAESAQYKSHMFREAAALPLKRVISAVFPVSDRLGVLELAVALFWNRVASAVVDWTVEFHGIKPTVPEIVHQEGEAFYRVDVDAGGRSEYLSPSVSVGTCTRIVTTVENHASQLNFHSGMFYFF